MGKACIDALSTQLTVVAQKDMSSIVHFMGIVRTGDDTLTTEDASLGKVTEFRVGMLSFWIVTPEALHGAPFQEHGCADAWTVVQRESLNVENNISSVHCDTVRGDSVVIDAAFSASVEEAGKPASAEPRK